MTKTNRILLLGLVTVALATAPALGADDDRARQAALERNATEQIEQIEEAARDIRYHAGRLAEMSSQIAVSSWSHYHHLDEIRGLVNTRIRPALDRINAMQSRLPGWKQDSVDRMLRAAFDLAADTSAAFFNKNSRPNTLPALNEPYMRLITTIRAHAEALVTTADAAHAYAVGRLKATEAGLAVSR